MRTEITCNKGNRRYIIRAKDRLCDCGRPAVTFLGNDEVCQTCLDIEARNMAFGILRADRLAQPEAPEARGVWTR